MIPYEPKWVRGGFGHSGHSVDNENTLYHNIETIVFMKATLDHQAYTASVFDDNANVLG